MINLFFSIRENNVFLLFSWFGRMGMLFPFIYLFRNIVSFLWLKIVYQTISDRIILVSDCGENLYLLYSVLWVGRSTLTVQMLFLVIFSHRGSEWGCGAIWVLQCQKLLRTPWWYSRTLDLEFVMVKVPCMSRINHVLVTWKKCVLFLILSFGILLHINIFQST